MRAPDHDPSQSAMLRLERGQIADATFVASAAVVDHQDVARLRALHRFQKNIDTSKMSDRHRRAGHSLILEDGTNARRCESNRNFQPQTGISNEQSRKFGKANCERLRFHQTNLREIAWPCKAGRFVTQIVGPYRIGGMNSVSTSSPQPATGDRWRFLRDVVVFQLKMFLDNVRDFALMPISLVAAVIDLIYKGDREGALFYRVLRWGAHSEEVINVYSAIEHHPPGDFRVNPAYTVDAVVARLESVVMRECEKGGTAANIKSAMDRVMDQVHRETKETGELARDKMARAAEKLRLTIDKLPD